MNKGDTELDSGWLHSSPIVISVRTNRRENRRHPVPLVIVLPFALTSLIEQPLTAEEAGEVKYKDNPHLCHLLQYFPHYVQSRC